MSENYLFEDIDSFNIKENNERKTEIIRKKRFKSYSPDEHSFFHLEPEKMFPGGTYERFIVDTINNLNLKAFEYTNEDDSGGNEEYNPKAILGILFYGYTNGIFHSRKLENLSKHDIRYMFISGMNMPEHSTISRFIIKYTKEIKGLFAQILYIAIRSGYVNYNMIAIDGTKIKANAGEKFSGTIEDFKKRKSKLEKKIFIAINKQKTADNKDETEYWKKKEERYKKEKEKINNFLEEASEIYTSKNKESKQNITDNDSRLMKESGGNFIQGYNAQISACGENGLITGSSISNCSSDRELLKPMIESTLELAPDDMKETAKEGKWISDNGYYSTENIKYCDEKELDAYISDKQDKNIYTEEINKEAGIKLNNDCILKGDFLYCPGGKKLKQKRSREKDRRKYCIFGIEDKKDCETCVKRNECIGRNKNGNKDFWVKEIILENIDKITKMKNKLRTEKGKMVYSRRMPTIEKVFGYIKGILNFNRFSLRNMEKVNVQWSLICSMYNLRRMYLLNCSK